MARLALAAVLALGLVPGCSEQRPYAGPPEKNLQVRTVSTGGSVTLEIYGIDGRCKMAYEGFVALDRQLVEMGLPTDRASLLVFEFRNPSFSNKKEVQVTPRAGNRYEAEVAHKDGIYDIKLRETDPRAGVSHDLDTHSRC